jgi:hypothetical protein
LLFISLFNDLDGVVLFINEIIFHSKTATEIRTITVMEFDTLFSEAILAKDETLPCIGQSPVSFGGRTFHYGVEAPDRAGVYVLIFEYQNRIHPLYVGHSRSIRVAISEALSERDALRRLAHGFYWTPVASEADGRHLADHLISELQPHFNAPETVSGDEHATDVHHDDLACCQRFGQTGPAGRMMRRQLVSWPACGLRRARHAPAKPAIRSKRISGVFR